MPPEPDKLEPDTLDLLFAEDEDVPDEVELSEAFSIETEAFHRALQELADAAKKLSTLAEDLEALRRTGLGRSDVVDLLYGRNNSLGKRDIQAVMGGMKNVQRDLEKGGRTREDLLARLVAAVSGANLTAVRSVFSELKSIEL